MLGLVIGTIITLVLFTLPGYLLSAFSVYRSYSKMGRIYFGIVLSMAIFIINGFVLSHFKMFTPRLVFVFLIAYNIFSIIVYMKYSKNDCAEKIPNVKTGHGNKLFIIQIILFMLVLLICFVYTQQSVFPIGYDRGQHFARSLYLLNHNTLPMVEPGTYSNPFYFQGPNLVITSFIASSITSSGLISIIDFNNFNSLINYSVLFKFFFVLIISFTLPAGYFISNYISKNDIISILSSIFIVLIVGFGLSDVGSIGTTLGFVFLSIFFVYFNILIEINPNRLDYVFFLLIIMAILFTHVIATTFMVFLLAATVSWKFLKKTVKLNNVGKLIFLMLAGFLFYLTFLSFVYPEHINGIVEEIARKGTENSIDSEINYIPPSYFHDNFNSILNLAPIYGILLFFMIGIFIDLKYIKSIGLPFMFTSLLFIVFPILPFVKTMNYLILPVSFIAGIGAFYVLKLGSRKHTILIFILISLVSFSATDAYLSASNKLYYNNYTYGEAYDLSVWLNDNLESSNVILYPGSGASAHLINALSNNNIIFAEPRYPDVHEYIDTSKVYSTYPTNIGIFNYNMISGQDRHNALTKYNISVIVETNDIKTNIDQLKHYYPKMLIYSPTQYYNVILLGDEK